VTKLRQRMMEELRLRNSSEDHARRAVSPEVCLRISLHGHQSPLPLPPAPHSLPESFPNRLNSSRPAPPEILKPTFKTQQHSGHGSVQVALSELPRRSAARLAPTFPRLRSSDQRL
jgi:hypothetical protein